MSEKMAISAFILKIAENDPFLRLQMRAKETFVNGALSAYRALARPSAALVSDRETPAKEAGARLVKGFGTKLIQGHREPFPKTNIEQRTGARSSLS